MDPAAGRWLYAAGLAIAMALAATSTAYTGRLLQCWTPPFNLLLSWPDNLVRLVLIALCVLLGAILGPGASALGWQTTYLASDVLIGFVAGMILATGMQLFGAAAVRRWGTDVYDSRLLRAIMPARSREWPGVLLALGPAALLEELLFRSLPLGGLGWLLAPQWLLWPLGLFFGLLHWPQGSWGVVGSALAAFAFSLLFLATGSIWAPLTAHYAMNIAQLVSARRQGITPLERA